MQRFALDVLVRTALAHRHVAGARLVREIAHLAIRCAAAAHVLRPLGQLSDLEPLDAALDLPLPGVLRLAGLLTSVSTRNNLCDFGSPIKLESGNGGHLLMPPSLFMHYSREAV